MLHLQELVRHPLSPVLHHSLHRVLLLSTAAVGASPVRFAAEDYLVTTCGLTREQAAKAAKHIAHCKSPSKANAVLSFLASPALGLSKADIAYLVSQNARVLNCSVEKTLRPRIDAFFNHGFTAAQIRTFLRVRVNSFLFRHFCADEKLGFWVPFLGSREAFLRAAKCNMYLLTANLDKVVKVNIQLLRESGLSDADISKLCVTNGNLLCTKPDSIRAILARARELGVPCNSPMFKRVLSSVSRISEENMAAKLKFIGQMLGCSEAEATKAVKTTPMLLGCSTERLHRVSEYLTKVVGVDSKYILRSPTILTYSLERRIAPRHYVMKVLMDNGLMCKEHGFYSLVTPTDKTFRSKYIIPHEDVLPGLADEYASACKGKLPPT